MTVNRWTTPAELARRRLSTQRLIGIPLARAEDVVGWLGAVQSQDYPLAKWSVGQRCIGVTDADLDAMLADGRILRTHILRPTWHFVLPADIRWLQSLVGPRVVARSRPRYLELGLDAAELKRALDSIGRALEGGRRLTRQQLARTLEQAGLAIDVPRLTHIVMYAELELVICSGAFEGRDNTYALVDERVPPAPELPRDEALARLARRYFASHGPSTVRDFTWWSSLTITDARRAIDLAGTALERTDVDGLACFQGIDWVASSEPRNGEPTACLLQAFDEFIVGYQATRTVTWDPNSFMNPIVLDGEAVGAWRRQRKKDQIVVHARLLRELAPPERHAVEAAVERYGSFVSMPAELQAVD